MYLTIFELPNLEISSFCSISVSDVMTVAIWYSPLRSLFSLLLLQGDKKTLGAVHGLYRASKVILNVIFLSEDTTLLAAKYSAKACQSEKYIFQEL